MRLITQELSRSQFRQQAPPHALLDEPTPRTPLERNTRFSPAPRKNEGLGGNLWRAAQFVQDELIKFAYVPGPFRPWRRTFIGGKRTHFA